MISVRLWVEQALRMYAWRTDFPTGMVPVGNVNPGNRKDT